MALKSAISTTKHNHDVKAFVTFRVVGENLIADEITQLLKIYPTHTHKKGETYSTGRSAVTPTSGMWLFSTEKILLSANLTEHIMLILWLFALLDVNLLCNFERANASNGGIALFRLAPLLRKRSLSATMSFFWHGDSAAPEPKVSEGFLELLKKIPVAVEFDFDKDEAA